jgi:hypothetical protein
VGNTVSVIEPAAGPEAPVSAFKKRRRSIDPILLAVVNPSWPELINDQRPAIGNGLAEIGKHSTALEQRFAGIHCHFCFPDRAAHAS